MFNPNDKMPNLIDNKLKENIIINQPINLKTRIQNCCINFTKKNYKILIIIVFILICLFWRYQEIKKKRSKKYYENFV